MKLDKSNDIILEQLRNIEDISVANDVTKFDKFTEVNETQSSNILLYFVTLVPINSDKSTSSILSHL